MKNILRFLPLLFLLLISGGLGNVYAASSPPKPPIYLAEVKGPIVPVMGDFIDRSIEQAEKDQALLLILRINTPGGLYSSTQEIVERMLNAQVPIVVYIAPSGSWAASAGTFITLAAHISVMAPATRLGAASPVSLGGSGAQPSEVMERKITEDAAAMIRSIATLRQRNVKAAESAVRQASSFTDEEAIKNNLVDFGAADLDSLLRQLDGREVTLPAGKVTLHTGEYTSRDIIPLEITGAEQYLFTLSNPNIAYILMAIGMTALFLELSNPGLILPGVIGGICLLLALYALGTLEANLVGMLLITLAFAFFIGEVYITSHGFLTAGGIASLLAGSLLLFSGNPGMPGVDWVTIAVVVGSMTLFFSLVIGAVARAHRRRAVTGREGLVGQMAVALSEIDTTGEVSLEGERWKVEVEEGKVQPGEQVVVKRVQGLKLWVTKVKKS